MSTCTQGVSPTNAFRNSAAVIDEALRPSGALSRSAYLPFTRSAYSGCSGSRQPISPVSVDAASTSAHQSSSLENSPAWVEPSATMIAPVSVARLITRSAPSSIA